MYKYSDVTDSVTLQPQQVWEGLDSFWRTKVVKSDADLVKYQTFATLVVCADTVSRSKHFIDAQGIATLEPYNIVPWYPLILYRDQLANLSYVVYGGPYVYDSPPDIVYGEAGDPTFTYPVLPTFAEIPTLYDSVTSTSLVLDGSMFSYDRSRQTLTFRVDPFTLLPARKTASGRDYLVLWMRNPALDLQVPFDWTGWVVKMSGTSTPAYVRTLQELWSLDVRAPALGPYKVGACAGGGFPVAKKAGTVLDIRTDGYQRIVVIDELVYTFPQALAASVSIGDRVVANQPLCAGITFYAGIEAASAPQQRLPGIAFVVPLSNGGIATLFAPNETLAWSFDAMRPSPWRFPLGGEVSDVEAYWTDRNVDLSTYYPGLVNGQPVNPMQLLVSDLWKNALTVASVDLTAVTGEAIGFVDRAVLALSPSTYLIVQQDVGDVEDSIDMGSSPENVGYGYHTSAPSDTISVVGTDLILSDYAPIVTLS